MLFEPILFYLQVTGELLDHLTCWDALRAALPVGTVSGAPKVHIFSSNLSPLLSLKNVNCVGADGLQIFYSSSRKVYLPLLIIAAMFTGESHGVVRSI